MKLCIGVFASIVVLVSLTLLGGLPEPTEPESLTQDPLWVIRKFNDSLNSRNVDVALALFADPVLFKDSAGQIITDRDSLRGWLQTEAVQNDQSEFSDISLMGSTVTWAVRVFRGDSVYQSQNTAVVQGGKFVAFSAYSLEQHSCPCAVITPKTSGAKIVWCSSSETPDEDEFYPAGIEDCW